MPVAMTVSGGTEHNCGLTTATCYFSSCPDKIPDESNLKDLGSQLTDVAHHYGEEWWQRCQAAGHTVLQVGKHKVVNPESLLTSLLQSGPSP